MSRRIDIELTSTRSDGTFTWRAAGAREPKGVVESSLLPTGSKIGDVLKVEAESDLDGYTIVSVVQGRTKTTKFETIQIEVDHSNFKPVTETRAPRDARRDDRRGDRRDDRRGDRRDDRRGERNGERRGGPGGRPGGQRTGERPERERRDGERRDGERPERERRSSDRPRRPRFEAPPEIPMRPKPKRLKPQNKNRREVLETIPAEQRAIAEMALKGIPAVRKRIAEDNARLAAAGEPLMPEHTVIKMAQDLLPKLRVAEWLDRAEAARRDGDELDLRDLRSVVAAAKDPLIEREERCRALAGELVEILNRRAVSDKDAWLADIEASVGVGRVVRALKLAGQPPKAGERFPDDLGRRLAAATADSLTVDAPADRWIAVLEAVAFSPIRNIFMVPAVPAAPSAELMKTVERLSPLIASVAALFGVDATGRPTPRPLMIPRGAGRDKARDASRDKSRGPKRDSSASGTGENAPSEPREVSNVAPPSETPASEAPDGVSPASETPADISPASESPASDSVANETATDPA